jgi:F0F1-type ATP synthase epsilon subunit
MVIMSTFHLQINTPDESLFDGQAKTATLVTSQGQNAYLADHWDSVDNLEVGVLDIITAEDEVIRLAINGGIATFQNNTLTVSTIEGEPLKGRKPDLTLFPKSIAARDKQVQEEIAQALQQSGVYEESKEAINSLLAEERLAKVQVLNEVLRG